MGNSKSQCEGSTAYKSLRVVDEYMEPNLSGDTSLNNSIKTLILLN
jgi:hypothetical protein